MSNKRNNAYVNDKMQQEEEEEEEDEDDDDEEEEEEEEEDYRCRSNKKKPSLSDDDEDYYTMGVNNKKLMKEVVEVKRKRPISYPWGPETRLEFVHCDEKNVGSSYVNVADTNKPTTTSISDPIKLNRFSGGSGATLNVRCGGVGAVPSSGGAEVIHGGGAGSGGGGGGGFTYSGAGGVLSGCVKEKVKVQVKPFTKESLERLERKTVQLVKEYGFQPRRKLSVEDGSRLPAKYEPFPAKLYGRPLEEIDNFIYDEVSSFTHSPS